MTLSWLGQYSPYLSAPAFVDALQRGGSEPRDADSFFESLLAPLDDLKLSTSAWTSYFMSEAPLQEVTTSPSAARDFLLTRLACVERVGAVDAATLARALFQVGDLGGSDLAAAVAYLGGDRSLSTLVLLMGMAVREGRRREAESVGAEAQERYPEAVETAFCQEILRVGRGDLAGAAAGLAALLKSQPEYGPAWRLLTRVLLRQEAFGEAARVAREAVRRHPGDLVLRALFVRSLRSAGRTESALREVELALEEVDRRIGTDEGVVVQLRLERAQLLEDAGRAEEALTAYKALLLRGESPVAVYTNAAACLKNSGHDSDAASVLAAGLEVHPQDAALLTNLGEIWFEAGRDETAFELLQRAAEADPSRTGNLVLMAMLCLRNRRFEAAAELASHVARVDPARAAEALTILGDSLRFRGQLDAALEAYRAASEAAPGRVEIAERLRRASEETQGD